MARYHLDWEIVDSRMPNTPKEIATGWTMLAGMVRADLESETLKDWGAFPGDRAGYAVLDGTEMDVMMFTMKYAPYVDFKARPVATLGQVIEFLQTVAR